MLEGADVVVLDVREAADYEGGRVGGARHVALAPWRDRIAASAGGFERPEAWAEALAALGVGEGSRVLVYDAGKLTGAAVVWVTLQRLGFRRASVVNGGYDALRPLLPAGRRGSGPARDAETRAPPRPDAFVPSSKAFAAGTQQKDDVRRSLAARDRKLLDARSAEEFSGADRRDNPRVGHLPGAVSLPHLELFGPDGLLLPPAALRERFARAGLAPGDRVTTYCQSGVRASLMALALVRAGFADVSNYFGSFGEWSRDASCPVEGSTSL